MIESQIPAEAYLKDVICRIGQVKGSHAAATRKRRLAAPSSATSTQP